MNRSRTNERQHGRLRPAGRAGPEAEVRAERAGKTGPP